MTTHKEALALARPFWDAKGNSGRVMQSRAEACIKVAGGMGKKLSSLTSQNGVTILTKLREQGLGRASVIAYYAAYRRMLSFGGLSTATWPGAGTPARRTRTPIPLGNLDSMIAWMKGSERQRSADLLIVLRGTGARINVEALSDMSGSLEVDDDGQTWWAITGKGGHERLVPVVCPEARSILSDPERLQGMRKLCYERHRQVWHEAAKAVGVEGFTPHSVRHAYATQAYHRSGKNLIVTRDLLGHADINTTAGYIGVDKAELLGAVQ